MTFAREGEHLFRVTDEEDIDGLLEESEIYLDEMVRHLFHEQHRFVAGTEDDITDHCRCVCCHRCKDFSGRRMCAIGSMSPVFCMEIVCVEWFVNDARIAALCEGVHEGGGDVPGARPEADPFYFHVSLGFLSILYSCQLSVLD